METTNGKSLVLKMLALFLGVMSVLAFIGIFVIVGYYRVFRSSAPVTNQITITGQGEIIAKADIAMVTITVTEEGKTLDLAQAKATTKVNAALDFLKKQGIDEKDIKTTNYYTNPKYENRYEPTPVPQPLPMMESQTSAQSGTGYAAGGVSVPTIAFAPPTTIYPVPCYYDNCPPTKSVIVGYETNQTLEVKIRKTDTVGTVIAGLAKLNAANVSNAQFTFDDVKKLQDQARAKAIEDARLQAQNLTKALGVHLGRIISYNEYGSPYNPMYYGAKMDMGMGGGYEGGSAPAPQFPAGENKITSSVNVTYEIN